MDEGRRMVNNSNDTVLGSKRGTESMRKRKIEPLQGFTARMDFNAAYRLDLTVLLFPGPCY